MYYTATIPQGKGPVPLRLEHTGPRGQWHKMAQNGTPEKTLSATTAIDAGVAANLSFDGTGPQPTDNAI